MNVDVPPLYNSIMEQRNRVSKLNQQIRASEQERIRISLGPSLCNEEGHLCQPIHSSPKINPASEQLRLAFELDAKLVKARHEKICLEQDMELERIVSEEIVRRRKLNASKAISDEPHNLELEDDTCPICFEEFLPSSNESYLLCCGKKTCQKCYQNINDRADCEQATSLEFDIANKCIFCKSHHPRVGKQEKKALAKHVKRKRPWAIYMKGAHLRDGDIEYGYHPEEAFQQFLAAAEMGHEISQTEVALCYNNGFGVKKSRSRAIKWLRHAIDNGHTRAQHVLGDLYLEGQEMVGCEEEEGLRLLKLATASNPPARAACSSLLSYNFQRISNSGCIDKKRLHLAMFWAEKLAVQDYAEGYYALACIIHHASETVWHPCGNLRVPEYDPLPTVAQLIKKVIAISTKDYEISVGRGSKERRKCIEDELKNAYRFQKQEIDPHLEVCPCGKSKADCVLKVCSRW